MRVCIARISCHSAASAATTAAAHHPPAGFNPFDLMLQVNEVEARQVRRALTSLFVYVCV